MQVDFYFDPTCPWCWITSRWLVDVARHRDLDLRWRTFSLALKDQHVDVSDRYRETIDHGLASLQVIEAARRYAGDDAVGRVYTELGRRIHHDGDRLPDLRSVLATVGLPQELASASGDAAMRAAVEDSMGAALALAGDDVGVPLIVFDGQSAIFGPVISPAPVGEEAARMFDHVAGLSRIAGFFELKRTRTSPPVFGARP